MPLFFAGTVSIDQALEIVNGLIAMQHHIRTDQQEQRFDNLLFAYSELAGQGIPRSLTSTLQPDSCLEYPLCLQSLLKAKAESKPFARVAREMPIGVEARLSRFGCSLFLWSVNSVFKYTFRQVLKRGRYLILHCWAEGRPGRAAPLSHEDGGQKLRQPLSAPGYQDNDNFQEMAQVSAAKHAPILSHSEVSQQISASHTPDKGANTLMEHSRMEKSSLHGVLEESSLLPEETTAVDNDAWMGLHLQADNNYQDEGAVMVSFPRTHFLWFISRQLCVCPSFHQHAMLLICAIRMPP